jgi:hypothetical protein
MNNLRLLSGSTSLSSRDELAISTYKGELTTRNVVKGIKRIKEAFPTMPPGFYDVLSERIKANGFTDERFQDAISHVIDNCHYPTPTIAQFISFDKKVKMFTYGQMLKMFDESGMSPEFWNGYKMFKFSDKPKPVWIHLNDVQQYNITEK